MSVRGTLSVVVAVVVGVTLVAVPVFGAVGGIAPAGDGVSAVQANETNDTATGNVSLGTRISSFMQASSAETDSAVESGMWAAEYNRSDDEDRPAVVQSRIDRLERRSERLRERMTELESRYENGTMPRVAYMAQASRLTAQLDALGESVNETDERARAVGVNTSRLDRLRMQTRNMSGREVAAVARGLGVGRPAHAGPPADRGPGDAGPPEGMGPSTNMTGDDRPGPPGTGGPNAGPRGDAGPAENVTSGERPGPATADDPTNSSDRAESSDRVGSEDSAGAEDSAGSNGPSGGPAGPSGGAGGGGPPGRN